MRWLMLDSGRIVKYTAMKIQIRKSDDGQFYYVVKGANGEIMLASETMTAKQSCLKSIERFKQDASVADIEDTTDE